MKRNVFLDIGGNKGQGLRKFIEMYQMDESWTIETFEPEILCELSNSVSDLRNVKVNNAAIWTYTGKVTFSRYEKNLEGGSVECLMSEGCCSDPISEGYRPHDNKIEVDCVGITELLSNYSNDDFIVMKMDVEGAEFEILRKALSDGSLSKINEIYVEFHTNHVKGESTATVHELIRQITNTGVRFFDWN
jgi:FkbM family methyltransferase